MSFIHRRYYSRGNEPPLSEQNLLDGYQIIKAHPLFGRLNGNIYLKQKYLSGKESLAAVDKKGNIYLNSSKKASAEAWAYVIAHCLLHLSFGHFDKDNLPDGGNGLNTALWNKACDIYICQFLEDTNFGSAICSSPRERYSIKLTEEKKIYQHLIYLGDSGEIQEYGTNGRSPDMAGLEHPLEYGENESNQYTAAFAFHLAMAAKSAVSSANDEARDVSKETPAQEAAQWFLSRYPLLGGLASAFNLIEDYSSCQKNEIRIAAVNAEAGEIYLNPTAGLSFEEWKFVLAHEYLHVGLDHAGRCQGRDRYLWNIACDYVINAWIMEMGIGKMPKLGVLYDESIKTLSAEAVYDMIVSKMRRFKKHDTFRGYGKGDVIYGEPSVFMEPEKGIRLDEFFKNALREGLDYHQENQRGFLPAGLVEEIRALSVKPIPWDVKLGMLFSEWFQPIQKHRTFARASRRQASTLDIPRPGYSFRDDDLHSRTFGVIVDTSGSMSIKQLGIALGAIASYAISRDVPAVRLVFCDAAAYDIGYVTPEDIAGRVEVRGRGGTALQPAVAMLEKEMDFPKDAPILIITDGGIENDLSVRRKHAYLLPKGRKLPFKPKGRIFYFGMVKQ